MKTWPAAMQLLVVGFYVALSLIVPAGIGFWFDQRAAHDFPWLTLVGLGVGTIIMVYGVYQMVLPFLKEPQQEGKESQLHGPARILSNLTSSSRKKNKEQK